MAAARSKKRTLSECEQDFDDFRRIEVGGDRDPRVAQSVSRGLESAGRGPVIEKAVAYLGIKDIHSYIPGMKVKLLPHQLIGVSWMTSQERRTHHLGGISADDMGLGKTVQMIATMVINQPSEVDEYHSTLIIVPLALLLQWKEELEAKTDRVFNVHIQHGKHRIKDAKLLQEKDVVITTYDTLKSDFNIPSDRKVEDYPNWVETHGGPMSNTKWYRVVCDEAQNIRNRSTRCSITVALLQAKYRWCLTGTPVINTLVDIYGYLRFGHFTPYNDWEHFNCLIAKVQVKDAPMAGRRARGMLKPILLRRTKNGKLENGEPILPLRQKEEELVYLEFSEDERKVYDAAEKYAQNQLNRFIESKSLKPQNVLIMILRLRQIATYPYLYGADGFRHLYALMDPDAEMEEEEPLCSRCGGDCMEHLSNSAIEYNDGLYNDGDQESFCIEGSGNVAAKCLRPCMRCQKMQNLRPNSVFVPDAFTEPHEEVREAQKLEPAWAPKQAPSLLRPVKAEDSDDDCDYDMGSNSDSGLDPDPKGLRGSAKTWAKGKDKCNQKKEDSMPPTLDTWKQNGNSIKLSVKMEQMVAYIKEWEAKGDKTIVFSQWTSMFDVCEKIFAQHNIRSLRFDGKMSHEARESCLSNFKQSDGEPKVMLVSTKCGGVGLNLVAANRVINLDLSWNYAVESQAYDRVHRFGQKKVVVVKRLVVRNTIEERMLKLQDTKMVLAEAALGEGKGTRLLGLGVEEIKDLLGMPRVNDSRDDGRAPGQSQ